MITKTSKESTNLSNVDLFSESNARIEIHLIFMRKKIERLNNKMYPIEGKEISESLLENDLPKEFNHKPSVSVMKKMKSFDRYFKRAL
jgi:hypothetical protein